jgi:NTE family protein
VDALRAELRGPEDLEQAEIAGPSRAIPGDEIDALRADGIALCLSGGGYRAMLFHTGALWRLNELGYLPRLDRVSSVSGGSITAGALARGWNRLEFRDGVASNFSEAVVVPVRHVANTTIDIRGVVEGVVVPHTSIADEIADSYDDLLFDKATLDQLPDRPRFVLNATSLQSGVLFRFSKPYLWDYRVGRVDQPTLRLAEAVAASAAFPPFLSPLHLRLDPDMFVPGSGTDLESDEYRSDVYLTDGGVYDNLGLETAWKRYLTVLVSDAGGRMGAQPEPHTDWPRQTYRVLEVIDNQVRSLRKRQVIASYLRPASDPMHRDGTYWSTRSKIANYPAPGTLPCPEEQTALLAATPTRLAKLDDEHQERLINWGYAISDAAMRAHVDTSLPQPGGFPYPSAAVG